MSFRSLSLRSLEDASMQVAPTRAAHAVLPSRVGWGATPAVLQGDDLQQASVTVLRGREAIALHLTELAELGRRTGQPAAGLYAGHFLSQPYTGGKVPCLLLFREPREPGKRATSSASGLAASLLLGAVLVHEYRRFGRSLRLYVGEDTAGERNVLAPAELRTSLALRAMQHLLRDRASLVLIALRDDGLPPHLPQQSPSGGPDRGLLLAHPQRALARRLLLKATYDATLATFGAHTRRNLRAYRRRAAEKLGCRFVAQAQISEADFIELNRLCAYPTPDNVAAWRYCAATTLPGGVLCGVRAGDGAWLGLLGGRRCDGTLYIDWQLNRLGFESFSPSTVLRAYVLEHEALLGTHTLLFEGGTPHPIRHAFVPDRITDLLAMRRTPFALALRASVSRLLPAQHPLVEALASPGLVWQSI